MINKKLLRGLYAITDPGLIPNTRLISAVEAVIAGGATIIQYRNKYASEDLRISQARQLRQLCQQHQVIFLINDDPVLAKKVAADGVHIGKHDFRIKEARQLLGENFIIGVSCYNQINNATRAIAAGADYIAFGRFFPSKTKPEAVQADLQLLDQAHELFAVPIVAIGGITAENAEQLVKHGADAVAVINYLFESDNIQAAAEAFQPLFK